MSHWKKIETALRQHALVRDCVVLDRENVPGNRCLVAYIVSNQTVVTANELRSHIKATLPNYRVPDTFIFRNSLPKTPDGIVDRVALMSVDQPKRYLSQGYMAPRTMDETLMANIWKETLKLNEIGIYDNFFEIVRDSSLAMEIIARVRKLFKVNLPVRALFADPTVAGMTAAVLQQQTKWINRRGLAECVSELALQRREQARSLLSKT